MIYGRFMDDLWRILVDSWWIYGGFTGIMMELWRTYERFTFDLWKIFGGFVEGLRWIYGGFMEDLWHQKEDPEFHQKPREQPNPPEITRNPSHQLEFNQKHPTTRKSTRNPPDHPELHLKAKNPTWAHQRPMTWFRMELLTGLSNTHAKNVQDSPSIGSIPTLMLLYLI